MKFLINDLIMNSSSFVNLIGDKVSMTLTPMQRRVALVAMVVFSLCALVYAYSYYFQAEEEMEKEDELITVEEPKPKTIEKRLEDNRKDALKQQMEERAKKFKIKERPAPSAIKVVDENGKECERAIFGDIAVSHTFCAGVACCQGRRETMEDAHILDEGSFGYPFKAFGICDGHGGDQASTFVKENFKTYLENALANNHQKELTDEGIFKALKECCKKLDADFQGSNGTTATVAVILEGKIWVANVGDSRTILVKKDGKAIQASEDAKPWMERYKKTIEKLGGMVILKRVNGDLAVARAIGDKHIVGARQEGEMEAKCCVSPHPKITCYPLADFEGGYLVLACDGLYDVATTNEVGRAIHSMDKKGLPVDEMSRRLVFSALCHDSWDNVSVMVVKLASALEL